MCDLRPIFLCALLAVAFIVTDGNPNLGPGVVTPKPNPTLETCSIYDTTFEAAQPKEDPPLRVEKCVSVSTKCKPGNVCCSGRCTQPNADRTRCTCLRSGLGGRCNSFRDCLTNYCPRGKSRTCVGRKDSITGELECQCKNGTG